MSFRRAIDEVLDAREPEETGTIEVSEAGSRAEVDVIEHGRIGVRVSRVKITRGEDRDIAEEAESLGKRLRSLGERVEPVEVAPTLGGAVLRTRPDEMREREFYQVEVQGTREVEVKRYVAPEGRSRKAVDWTMTRDQLGRLVGELDE